MGNPRDEQEDGFVSWENFVLLKWIWKRILDKKKKLQGGNKATPVFPYGEEEIIIFSFSPILSD